MSKALRGLDRTIFILLALVLIVLGVWPILMYFNVEFATELARWVQHDVWASVPEQSWYIYVLVATGIIALFFGIWLTITNVRSHRFNAIESAISDDAGSVTTLFNSAGQGIAQSLAKQPGIQSAKSKVSIIEKQKTLTFTVLAQATTELAEVRRLVEESEQDFRSAFPDAAVRTVYNLHFDKVTK